VRLLGAIFLGVFPAHGPFPRKIFFRTESLGPTSSPLWAPTLFVDSHGPWPFSWALELPSLSSNPTFFFDSLCGACRGFPMLLDVFPFLLDPGGTFFSFYGLFSTTDRSVLPCCVPLCQNERLPRHSRDSFFFFFRCAPRRVSLAHP